MKEMKPSEKAGWHFNNSYIQLPNKFYTIMNPTPVDAPSLIKFNHALAVDLGLSPEEVLEQDFAEVGAGNALLTGMQPLAQAYAGHQFGYFNMLGDGRAILLGEHITPNGKRVDIQLKGSGPTPYSRSGDGRAAIGPMLREYIISEAMHALGIPTSRSLAVVETGETVYRETKLKGAILTRVAASHLRVGTFQYAASYGTRDELQALADYTINRHYDYIANSDQRYLQLLQEVIKKQAKLISQWQLVGFIHGVMNTDNMALSGETIDYGPCAFMDTYDISTVFSSIDTQGRYAYGNQPYIAAWNLARFAESLLPLLHEDTEQAVKLAEEALGHFTDQYYEHWQAGMRAKLGLFDHEETDEALIEDLLKLMQQYKADYTNTFVALTFDQIPEAEALFQSEEFVSWKARWEKRTQSHSKEEVQQLMKQHNPAIIPRNYQVEEALHAAENGDFEVMDSLLAVLANPYAHQAEQCKYAQLPNYSMEGYRTFCGT